MIGILDIGMCNLQSVSNAVNLMGFDCELVPRPEGIEKYSHLILPGVGAFPTAMKRLQESKLIDAICIHADRGKPLLGICLGMQLLATRGTELESCAGLNLIPGEIIRFPPMDLVVPHVGWNNIAIQAQHPVFEKVKSGVDFYFVHSFIFIEKDKSDILATSEYGVKFNSAIARGNIVGLQFHPEKSQINGLKLIENFCEWDGQC